MEVCVPSRKSSCLDGCSNRGTLKNPLKTTKKASTDLSVSDLKTCLDEVIVKHDIDVKISGKNNVSNVIWENEINGKNSDRNKSAQSDAVDGFFLVEKKEDDTTDAVFEVNDLDTSISQSFLQSKSLPTSSKLVSALKGSREKQGMAPKKLSVTWAPDVYDPIPTSISHVPSSKNQHHYRSYGKRKNKHKRGGKSSRSSSKDSREKKQTRKNIGTCSKHKQPIIDNTGIFTEPFACAADFATGNPNPFCGSSLLLKNSVSKLHFPPAEAT